MWHPLEYFSPGTLGWLLLALMAFTIILYLRLQSLGRRLRNGMAPLGIVSLEMCLSSAESRGIIDSWDEDAREDARRLLCLDYFFIPVYTTALAVLGVMASRWFLDRGLSSLATIAIVLAWGQWVAGLFDFTENSALLRILSMYPDIPEGLTVLAGWSARIKFLLIMMAVLCCLFGLVTSLA